MFKSPVLRRAVQLIIADPVQTLRVIAPGLLLLFLSQFTIGHYVLVPVSEGFRINALNLIAMAAITYFAIVMINVAWHRYALLEGPQRGALLRPTLRAYGYYALRAAWLWIAVMFFSLFACVVASMLLSRMAGYDGGGLWILDSMPGVFLTITLGFWIMLRFGLVLPAAAMGIGFPMTTSMAATAPMSGELFRVAIVLAALSLGQKLWWFAPSSALVPIFAFLATTLLTLQILISASVLSALYGTLVQGRRL